MERIDAAEQGSVVQDAVAVAGAARRDVALDREQRRVGVGAGKHVEHVADPPQEPPAQFERRDRVVEARRRRIGRNRRHLGVVLGEGCIEGGPEMLRRDAAERRRAGRPVFEKRIGGGSGCGGDVGHRMHVRGPWCWALNYVAPGGLTTRRLRLIFLS